MSCLSLLVALSLHVGLEGNYNNLHPHVRCQVDNQLYGVCYNSESNISAYGGLEFDAPFDSKLEVGLVAGYSGADIVPMARLTKDNWFIAPSYETEPDNNWGITFGYEFKIW